MSDTASHRRRLGDSGQAAVELIALLPLVVVVLLLLWQLALAGHATWAAGAAARSAARAHALGADAEAAARARLPRDLRTGLRVRGRSNGAVEVGVRIPLLVRRITLGYATSAARFADQGA